MQVMLRGGPVVRDLSFRKEPEALQETAVAFSLLSKTKIQTTLALCQQEHSLKHMKQWCQWKHHPEWVSPVEGRHLKGSHHVTRETWLCSKDCSWQALGFNSLPCSWEASLEAAWRELLCTATLRHACTSRLRSCHCCSTGRDLLLRGSGLLTALCSVTLGCFTDAQPGAQGFLLAWQSPTWCWGSCHHGSSTGRCCSSSSKACKVQQEVSDGEAAHQHLHLPGAAPQVGILLSPEVQIFLIEQKREILSVFYLECSNMKKKNHSSLYI